MLSLKVFIRGNAGRTHHRLSSSKSTSSAAPNGLERLLTFKRFFAENEGIGKTLKFELEAASAGRVAFVGTPGKWAYNPTGTVHGGWTAALLDSACACASMTLLDANQASTTLELKVSYLAAMTDATGPVRAEGVVIKGGKRAAFAEAKLTSPDGKKLYATATSTLLVMDTSKK